MRALVPVAIVAIIAVVVLVIWLTARRHGVKRGQVAALRAENDRLSGLVNAINDETNLQLAAGNASHGYTAELLADYFIRREIAR